MTIDIFVGFFRMIGRCIYLSWRLHKEVLVCVFEIAVNTEVLVWPEPSYDS